MEKETLDEKLPGLFEPDTLLPIQYFEAMRRKHLLEGEKRLILSVLEDAVECFMKCIDSPTNKGQRLFRDAEEWINLEDKHWVFSFDNVCDMLDINAEYMRNGLRRWKERKLEATAVRAEAARLAAEQAASAAAAETPASKSIGAPNLMSGFAATAPSTATLASTKGTGTHKSTFSTAGVTNRNLGKTPAVAARHSRARLRKAHG